MGRLIQLFARGDSFDFSLYDDTIPEAQLDINISVGLEMRKLLSDGKLPDTGREILCPVVAIQGNDDLRGPVDTIRGPLTQVIENLRLIRLEKCGHYPWFERRARDYFFSILHEELPKELSME